MAQDRVYINQCSLKEKVFDNGGSLINAAFKVSELEEHADENGWVNIVIAKRREVSEKVQHTMHIRANTRGRIISKLPRTLHISSRQHQTL